MYLYFYGVCFKHSISPVINAFMIYMIKAIISMERDVNDDMILKNLRNNEKGLSGFVYSKGILTLDSHHTRNCWREVLSQHHRYSSTSITSNTVLVASVQHRVKEGLG